MTLKDHSYEELRDVAVSILLGQEAHISLPEQWLVLVKNIGEAFAKREKLPSTPYGYDLTPNDKELTRDVFWDLFRQGFIILGKNDSNPNWPFFRLSHFGKKTLSQGHIYRFTDTSSYIEAVKSQVGTIDSVTQMYLEDAVTSFYAGALLASSVMLGVAAENRFLMLLDTLSKNSKHKNISDAVEKERHMLGKITKFRQRVHALTNLPAETKEDLDIRFDVIQSLIRISRNETGHPSGKIIDREQMYILLQLFIPFAKKVYQLDMYFAMQE